MWAFVQALVQAVIQDLLMEKQALKSLKINKEKDFLDEVLGKALVEAEEKEEIYLIKEAIHEAYYCTYWKSKCRKNDSF